MRAPVWYRSDPCRRIGGKGRPYVRRPLTKEQVGQLVERAGPRGSLERAVVMFMLGTGVRLNEAREARVGDIDLDACTFTVRPETSKFGRSRVTYFHRDVAAEIDLYLREREDRWDDDPTTPLFPNAQGRPYNDDGWDKLFQRLKRRSGIADFCAHRLRHTWALPCPMPIRDAGRPSARSGADTRCRDDRDPAGR